MSLKARLIRMIEEDLKYGEIKYLVDYLKWNNIIIEDKKSKSLIWIRITNAKQKKLLKESVVL